MELSDIMSGQLKYAIFDTDFVSKVNIIKTDDRALADEVLSFPNYRFFCHQKMKEELSDHGTRLAQDWLDKMISKGRITCFSDERILQELKTHVFNHRFSYYRSFLKNGCDLFNGDFYNKFFPPLDEYLDTGRNNDTEFLSVLQSCEAHIGHQQSYGEVKSFVLSQTLRLLYDIDTHIFCSDDYGARQGFANGAQIPCISILSVFLKLKLIGKSINEVQPYYQSFVRWSTERINPQTHVKVWEFTTGSNKRIKVPITTLLEDIYADKYKARKDGDLQKV